ncbi:hypothetical protein Cni_G25880 [Canna indica]|uniref:Uncharacterized protein n=1 Tax=Canna indica TaxID=4628 RepID=A0AAQ3QLG4_9LILI|nr:hypothetical protein Cni_G25880 [Canna indica]
MASLTPGVLLKLLQSMNTDARVTSEYRSAVLQVVGIVPALSASTGDDLWPSHGFYLQLSDSANSTYVSLSDADADAVLSTRSQLGQLVHVDRLQFAHPVPRAVGLRPVPGARPHPFVGSPTPLVARSSPNHHGFVIQPASSADAGPPLLPASLRSKHNHLEEDKRTVFAAKENVVVGSGKNQGDTTGKPRRFSSPSAAKVLARNSGAGSGNSTGELLRDPSSAMKTSSRPSSPALVGRARSRPTSPAPSKCEVPSLVAAKEENRRVAREPAIIVPSRYRQPSPAGRKAAASPMGRRGSMSPARRLSGGIKVASPATGEGGGKKKHGVVVAGIARVSDAFVGSMKSMRKSWDDSSVNSVVTSDPKVKEGSKSKMDKESISRTQIATSRRLSDVEAVQATSSSEKLRTIIKSDSLSEPEKGKSPPSIVHDKKWTDGSIPLDTVPEHLARLGKACIYYLRNIASIAAAEALEEALVTESVIRCLSMFSELCSLSKVGNPVPTIDRFLSIYDDVLRWNTLAESLFNSRNNDSSKDAILIEQSKLASLWVQAALATDLEVIHLVNNDTELLPKRKADEKPVLPQVDPPRTSLSRKQSIGTPAKSHRSKVLPSVNNTWIRGHGVSETVDLSLALRKEMQVWFLKFVEEAIELGFRLFGDNSDNNKVAVVLSQLKKINDWLDGVVKTSEGETLKEKIEILKHKIYGFVIGHVGSTLDTSISIGKA